MTLDDDLKLRCTFQAITKKLNDPLLSQGSTRLEEDRTVVRCVTGNTMSDKEIEEMRLPPAPLVPLGRHGTECNTWLRMQLHDIDSGVRKRSGSVVKINLTLTAYYYCVTKQNIRRSIIVLTTLPLLNISGMDS